MIGVLSKTGEAGAVEEFFQLFKTPWEFFDPQKHYDVVITTCGEVPEDENARVVVIYESHPTAVDDQIEVAAGLLRRCEWVEWQSMEFPIYGDLALLRSPGQPLVRLRRTLETVGCIVAGSARPTVRLGFDLFSEVTFLLSEGQPPENARFATLDTHIALLRAILLGLNVPFVEVPPIPPGFEFMACLTHDVDFVGIRDHRWDHTMWGFLYRSLAGSLLRALRGRLSWSKCWKNWTAAWSLPLVHLGLREDFWLEFDRYLEMEKGLGSTFYFIPFKNVPGTLGSAPAPPRRSAKYDVTAIGDHIAGLLQNGCEISLHGIDAWQDTQSGRAELQRIREITGQSEVGARMHWLYWNTASPRILEEVGFAYDSTCGYNDAVGFRAGTSQPFRPLGAERLLELPLNIQDSAMFYSDRMGLPEADALGVCRDILRSLAVSGGALTINWHTRSLSPERLWGDFYAELLREIRTHRVWFGTARQIVGWYQKRRALRFDSVQFGDGGVQVRFDRSSVSSEFSFTVKIHHPAGVSETSAFPNYSRCSYVNAEWHGGELVEAPN